MEAAQAWSGHVTSSEEMVLRLKERSDLKLNIIGTKIALTCVQIKWTHLEISLFLTKIFIHCSSISIIYDNIRKNFHNSTFLVSLALES